MLLHAITSCGFDRRFTSSSSFLRYILCSTNDYLPYYPFRSFITQSSKAALDALLKVIKYTELLRVESCDWFEDVSDNRAEHALVAI